MPASDSPLPAAQPRRREVGSGRRRNGACRGGPVCPLDIERVLRAAQELGASGVRITGTSITILFHKAAASSRAARVSAEVRGLQLTCKLT